jgi:hypothetical protein
VSAGGKSCSGSGKDLQRCWREQDYSQLRDTLKVRINGHDSQISFERCSGDQRINIPINPFP